MTSRPVALITGASAGLGAEFARALAARGADLILTARREERLVALAKQLQAEHGTHTDILAVDLARSARSKVRIQSLCPGYTVTEFHDVLGMDRGLVPKFLWLDAPFVVRESLAALERNDVLVIPSWKYRFMVRMAKCLPRVIRYAVAERVGRRMRRV